MVDFARGPYRHVIPTTTQAHADDLAARIGATLGNNRQVRGKVEVKKEGTMNFVVVTLFLPLYLIGWVTSSIAKILVGSSDEDSSSSRR